MHIHVRALLRGHAAPSYLYNSRSGPRCCVPLEPQSKRSAEASCSDQFSAEAPFFDQNLSSTIKELKHFFPKTPYPPIRKPNIQKAGPMPSSSQSKAGTPSSPCTAKLRNTLVSLWRLGSIKCDVQDGKRSLRLQRD